MPASSSAGLMIAKRSRIEQFPCRGHEQRVEFVRILHNPRWSRRIEAARGFSESFPGLIPAQSFVLVLRCASVVYAGVR
jgi:hypothetical protein